MQQPCCISNKNGVKVVVCIFSPFKLTPLELPHTVLKEPTDKTSNKRKHFLTLHHSRPQHGAPQEGARAGSRTQGQGFAIEKSTCAPPPLPPFSLQGVRTKLAPTSLVSPPWSIESFICSLLATLQEVDGNQQGRG